ncbi:MAG TPA: hypothetical protein VNW99_06425 [Cytophagaceae bacterium]|jgi:hypothetical protein|nr:hypothetical protein [Cytophagaceae bacterium]
MKTTKLFTAIAAAVLFFSLEGNAQTWNIPSTGASNTASYIGTTTANDVIINTGGTGTTAERMRILGSGTNNGFVGIGTSTPASLLNLSGASPTLTLTGTGMYPSNTINFSTGGSISQGYYPAFGSGSFRIYSGTSNMIRMESSNTIFSSNTGYGSSAVASANYQFDGSLASQSVLISDNTSPILTLPTGFSLGVKGKSYFGDKVGIGTTAPLNKLDIAGGAVIGSSYAGVNTAPANGLLVQGNVGIGNNFSSTTLPYASFQHWNQWGWPLSMGSFSNTNYSTTGYATTYLGFNAGLNTSTSKVQLETDGGNNGGAMVVGNVGGTLNFFTFPTATPSSAQIIDPASSSFINYRRMVITQNGAVVIGNVATPNVYDPNTGVGYSLYAVGGILTEKVKVALHSDAVNWSDFVFDKSYKLRSLNEVEKFITKNKHLPEIPSAKEVYANGIDVAEMDAKLLMKIEELTLYMIEMQKEIKALKKQNQELGNK